MIVWCVLFWPRLVRLKWWAHAAQFIFLGTKWTDIFTWKTKWYMLMCSYYFLGMNNSNEKKKLLFRLHFLFVSSSMFFSLFRWTIKNACEWLRAWVRGRWRYTIRFGVWLMDLWFQWCGFRTRCVPLNHKPSAHRSTLIDHLNKICRTNNASISRQWAIFAHRRSAIHTNTNNSNSSRTVIRLWPLHNPIITVIRISIAPQSIIRGNNPAATPDLILKFCVKQTEQNKKIMESFHQTHLVLYIRSRPQIWCFMIGTVWAVKCGSFWT